MAHEHGVYNRLYRAEKREPLAASFLPDLKRGWGANLRRLLRGSQQMKVAVANTSAAKLLMFDERHDIRSLVE